MVTWVRRWIALVGTAAWVAGCGSAAPVASPAPDSPSRELARLIAAYEQAGRVAAGSSGVSFDAVRRRADTALAWLASLGAIDTTGLSVQERLSREVLAWEAEKIAQDTLLYWYRFDVLPALSPLRGVTGRLAAQPVATPAERDRYVEILEDAAGTLNGLLEKMRAQAVRGVRLSQEQVDRVIAYLRGHTAPASQSPFAVPASRRGSIPDAARAGFDARAARAIDGAITPAVQALIQYIDGDVRRHAAAGVGLWQYPGGVDAYRMMVRRETTLDITPEAIHALALAAMDTLEARMQRVRDSLGFRGTKAEFHEQLRRDRRFYVDTPAQVGDRLMAYAERIEPLMNRVFAVREKAPYGVRRLHPALEPSMTYGYYNFPLSDDPKGYYNFNGSDLDERSLLVAGAIAFHELVPGHHYHINLQRENQDLPPFRRYALNAGFTEGWAEYASSIVAAELGMYRDAYEIYGRLVFDAFFIARLVVDTGMNLYQWPRARAVAYMKEHTLESDVQIDSETLRYSTRSPAQALAYRMGREVMVGLRERAERELGSRFDIKRFHAAILANGTLPLFLLERQIAAWIAAERNRGTT